MQKIYKLFFASSLLLLIFSNKSIAQCVVPGTASASKDSICDNDSTTLHLTGYTGNIQWQSYNGSVWVNETGPGATSDTYLVTLIASIEFRAYVTMPSCPDDSSNAVQITVGFPAPATTGATRCGYGPVTLNAVSAGNVKWYDALTGGNQLGTGLTFSPTVSATTTFWAEAISNGGGSGVTPMPVQNSTFSSNARGYWFTAPANFTIIGLYVPTPANGTTQNIAVVKFDNAVPPPVYATTTNAFTTLFLTQNDGSTGVIPVNIPIVAGDVIGLLATRGSGDVNSYATSPATTTINGQTVTIARMGMQYPLATTAPQDLWTEVGGSISRVEITYQTGCESPRTATVATVSPSTPVNINASTTLLCQGQSASLTATSANSGYSYTWSPSAGLNITQGQTVTATPLVPTTYVVVGDDGTCGSIDSVFINVGQGSVAGIASTYSDTVCFGNATKLMLAGSLGSIQWQSYLNPNWINETGPGFDSTEYIVTPTASTQYRALVTNAGCPPDSTAAIPINVFALSSPSTVGDTICGPGIVNLSANLIGSGSINWYADPNNFIAVGSGSSFAPSINNSTTYYADASVSTILHNGANDLNIGNPANGSGQDYGLQFDCSEQCILQRVYVSTTQSGLVTVNLRASQGGPILATASASIPAFSGLKPVELGFNISPGTGYRLELQASSVNCYRNSTGAVYPYTVPNCPITITGYVNPTFNTGVEYFWFYDWQVDVGCHSARVPVTGFVNPLPPTPTITKTFNTLMSSSATGNQWYLNGTIMPGETGQYLTVTQTGTYTVVVTDANGCSSTSPIYVVNAIGINEIDNASFNIFPNPANNNITISFAKTFAGNVLIKITDLSGRIVYLKNTKPVAPEVKIDFKLPAGNYIVEVESTIGIARQKLTVMNK